MGDEIVPIRSLVSFGSEERWTALVPLVVGGCAVKKGETFPEWVVIGDVKFSDLGRGAVSVSRSDEGVVTILNRSDS